MGRTFSLVLGAMLLLGAPIAAPQTPEAAGQAAYKYQDTLPEQLPGVGLETPRQAFLDILTSRGLAYRTNTAADVFAVALPGGPFVEVVYFFNSSACDCLTEIEIRFADDAQAVAYFTAKFPSVNIRGEFFGHDGVSSYRVKAWRFTSKVYVVGIMPDTRWANQ
jgi:hypothetical protein